MESCDLQIGTQSKQKMHSWKPLRLWKALRKTTRRVYVYCCLMLISGKNITEHCDCKEAASCFADVCEKANESRLSCACARELCSTPLHVTCWTSFFFFLSNQTQTVEMYPAAIIFLRNRNKCALSVQSEKRFGHYENANKSRMQWFAMIFHLMTDKLNCFFL